MKAGPELVAAHRKGFEIAARAGYAARGVVYLLIGIIAFQAAFGGENTEGAKGAIQSLMDNTAGQWLVGLLAVGMFGFAAWRFLQGGLDTDNHGSDGKGLAVRTALIFSGVSHLLLGLYAISLITTYGGAGSGGGENGAEGVSTWLMSQPFGRWLVGILGVIVIGVALVQIGRAVKESYRKNLNIDFETMRWASPVCRFGIAARAVAFIIIGVFFVIAGYNVNPEDAKGLQEALQYLREQPYGTWMLALLGIGLMAFAIYNFVQARYRIVRTQ